MIKFLISDINDYKDEEFASFYEALPSYRKNKIDSYKFDNDKKLSILSGKLLHDLIENEDSNIFFNEFGKGYIKGRNDLYFSISHSKEKVLVAISDKEIGCDIEKINVFNLDIAKRFFTKEEYEYLASSINQNEESYRLWTLKEAYLKCTGQGLNKGLNSVSFINQDLIDYEIIKNEKIKEGYFFSIIVKR